MCECVRCEVVTQGNMISNVHATPSLSLPTFLLPSLPTFFPSLSLFLSLPPSLSPSLPPSLPPRWCTCGGSVVDFLRDYIEPLLQDVAPVGVGMCDCGIKLICNLNIRCDSHVTVRVSHMTVHVQGM